MQTTDIRYATSIASLAVVRNAAALDMTQDDMAFFTGDNLWIATDRSRARRCVEAAVYGALDFCGYPRFAAPVEFIAAAIAYFVSDVNLQTACLIMEGAEFSENMINGIERSVSASELFAHVLRVRANSLELVYSAEDIARFKLRGGNA